MAQAKRLESGSWRVQAGKVVNGKKLKKSFTVSPDDFGGDWKQAKKQAEYLANEWQLSSSHSDNHDLTVREAIESYISDKNKVLSPSTIRGYKLILDSFGDIADIYISDIETRQIQRIINDMSIDYKTKTIRNRIGLLMAVLDYHGTDKKYRLRYPQNNSKKVTAPDIEDVQMLIRNSNDTMKAVIYLAAFGSLRRGEIAGLRGMDVSKDMLIIRVNGDMVLTDNGKWIYKAVPKTEGSARTVQLPKFVIDALPVPEDPKAFLFDLTPAAMTDRFRRLANRLGLPYTLHSLRHFAASFRSDLGIPRKYVEEVGGWAGESSILTRVYDNGMESSRRKYTQIANKFIEDNFDFSKEQKTI